VDVTKQHTIKTQIMQKEIENLENKVKDIQKEIESLKSLAVDKPKFEVGKWYVDPAFYGMFNYQIMPQHNRVGFGISSDKDWVDSFYLKERDYKDYRLATESEVSSHLIEEAKRRGYKTGVKIKSAYDNFYVGFLNSDKFKFSIGKDRGLELGETTVYNDKTGQWSEIIPVEEKILIGCYKVEILPEGIKIGCKLFKKHILVYLKDLMTEKGFKEVSFDGTPATLDQLNKILDKLK